MWSSTDDAGIESLASKQITRVSIECNIICRCFIIARLKSSRAYLFANERMLPCTDCHRDRAMAAIIEFQLRFGKRGSNAFPRGIRLQLVPMIALSHLEGDKGNIGSHCCQDTASANEGGSHRY